MDPIPDGHEAECDIAGTDSSRSVEAGAYGAAVFFKGSNLCVKKGPIKWDFDV